MKENNVDSGKVMLVKKELKVYAYDIDVMGIVSNIVYVRWFEDLRTKMLDIYFPLKEMLSYGAAPILAKTEIEYKFPVTIDDEPVGEVWVEKMGRSKWELGLRIFSGDRTHCIGKQVGYYYNMQDKRPAPMPQKFYDLYLAEVEKSRFVLQD